MNSEHLFAGEGELRDRVIEFVRQPGALDMLFNRLLAEKIDDSEQLAVAELLVYFGQYRVSGDERLWSDRAQRVLAAVNQGRFDAAEKKYPEAPIKEQIVRAARLSEAHRFPATQAITTTQPATKR